MGQRATAAEIKKFEYLHFTLGQHVGEAAKAVGKSEGWGRTTAKRLINRNGYEDNSYASSLSADPSKDLTAGPKRLEQLRDVDRRALDDFGMFRQRFFGRSSLPWSEQAAHKVEELLISQQKEYVVINVAPGLGKTTLLHDISAWQTAKRRYLRAIWGSSTATRATTGTRRLRQTLERPSIVRAKEKDRERGYAKDAEAVLVESYGRFRPINGLWRADTFTVWGFDEEDTGDKEATWEAFGQDSEQLGTRVDWIVWDDLVTGKSFANTEAMERQQTWYDNEAEPRLEMDGLLVFMGQRLNASDLYRYNLDKLVEEEFEQEFDDAIEARLADSRRHQYHHIVYKAHDEILCKGHGRGAVQEPWPKGCLLDPYKLPWRQCLVEKRDPERWEIVFQQNDVSGVNSLVQRIWIDGGFDDKQRINHPGCWDENRALLELPDPKLHEGRPLISYVAVDPSVSNWWGFLNWVVDPVSGLRWLIDLKRVKMLSGGFLQEAPNGEFEGIVADWQRRSIAMGVPITRWVVEANAAHKYLQGYGFVSRFEREFKTRFIQHTTGANKSDPKFGIGTIGALYQHGQKRLPGLSRLSVKPLINELLAYPDSATSDLVMADWIGEFNLQFVIAADQLKPIIRKRDIGRSLRRGLLGV